MTFSRRIFFSACIFAGTAYSGAAAGASHAKQAIDLPPPATLHYSVRATLSGLDIEGTGLVRWQATRERYSVFAESGTQLVGKLLEASSEGGIDAFGLAPHRFVEKKFRKKAATATFDRSANRLTFSASQKQYPLTGGEQDRSSIVWQLASMARAAPLKFKTGSTWPFVVAGPRDASDWMVKVVGQEKIRTRHGEFSAIRVTRLPAKEGKDQSLDIWLAPSLEWYPVRIRYAEPDGDTIEHSLTRVVR